MASGRIVGDYTEDITSQATIADPLPTGVTNAAIEVVRAGKVVTVNAVITRDATVMTNYTTVATGLPKPKVGSVAIGSITYAMGHAFINSDENARPLVMVVRQTDGALRIARGGAAGTYVGEFTYITDE